MEMHLGQMIKDRLKETGMKKTEFARRINITSQNVYDIFKRKSIDSNLLLAISETLNYNFLEPLSLKCQALLTHDEVIEEMANKYGATAKIMIELKKAERKLGVQQAKIKQLQTEVEYLKEINVLLRRKGK
jgi:plasmid maintenance system antidote protein VapI